MFGSLLFALVASRISNDELNLLRGQLAKIGQEPIGAAVDVTLGYPKSGCTLGAGFDFGSMGCGPTPAKGFPSCKVYPGNTGKPCHNTIKQNPKTTHYTNKVSSKTQLSKQISGSISAEGAGWGVTASVSAKYMSDHQSTDNSVAFYLGQAGIYNKESIEFGGNLEIGQPQLDLLTTSPEEFLNLYGRYYVSAIGYGGTFMGSYEFQSSMNSDSTSLSVAESMSYDVVFSEKGTYDQKISEMSSYVTMSTSIKTSGGEIWKYAKDTPYGMVKDFNAWLKDEKKSQGNPMTVTISSWFTLQAVQDALIELGNATVTEMFNQSPPGPTVMSKISQEYILAKALTNTVVNALTWDCATLSTTFKAALQNIEFEIDAHLAKIESLTEEDVFEIERQVIKEDQSWFQATNGDFGLQELIDSNKACRPCTVVDSFYSTGPLLEKKAVANYRTCEKMCQQNDKCAVWSEYDGQCYLRSEWRSPTSKTGAKSGVKTCHCFNYGGYDSPNAKTLQGTIIAASDETVYTWKLLANKDIPHGNLAGCSKFVGQDIRKDPLKLDECKSECETKSDCVGLTADWWGTTLLKTSADKAVSATANTFLLTRTKHAAIYSGPGCQRWCNATPECVSWGYIPANGDGCALFSDHTGRGAFPGYISGPPTCKFPIDLK